MSTPSMRELDTILSKPMPHEQIKTWVAKNLPNIDSQSGSLILKKDGRNILEFYLGYGGSVRFRRKTESGDDNFAGALGDECGRRYQEGLDALFPRTTQMGYPNADFKADHAERVLPLLREVLSRSGSEVPPS